MQKLQLAKHPTAYEQILVEMSRWQLLYKQNMSLLCLCPLCLGSRCFSSNSLSSCCGKKGYWPTSQSTFAQKGTAKQKTFIFIHSAALLGTEWPDMVSYILLVKDTMGYELSRTR